MEQKYAGIVNRHEQGETCPDAIRTLGNVLEAFTRESLATLDDDVPLFLVALIAYVYKAIKDNDRRSRWLRSLSEAVRSRSQSRAFSYGFDRTRLRRFEAGLMQLLDLLENPSSAIFLIGLSKAAMGEKEFEMCISEQEEGLREIRSDGWKELIHESSDLFTSLFSPVHDLSEYEGGLKGASSGRPVPAHKETPIVHSDVQSKQHDWRPAVSSRLPIRDEDFSHSTRE